MKRFLFTISIIIFLWLVAPASAATISTSNTSAPNLKTGLVGWWTFDGVSVTSTGVLDKSGQNNNGGRMGGTSVATGKVGQGIKLNGTTGYISGANSTDIASTPVTVSVWVKFLTIAPGNNYPRIIDVQDSNYSVQIVWDYGTGGSGQFVTKHSEWQAAGDGTQWGVTPVLNKWYHLVAVWDASANSTKFYVNGIEQSGSANSNIGEGASRNKYFFGVRGDLLASPNTFGNEVLDDVRIYSRTLSATEVQALYKQGGGVISKTDLITAQLRNGLGGLWTFDGKDTTSVTTTDKSGNGNDGTRSGLTKVIIGKIGQGMNFDAVHGSGQITITSSPSVHPTGSFTLSAWVNRANAQNAEIIQKGTGAFSGAAAGTDFEFGFVSLLYFQFHGSDGSANSLAVSAPILNQWQLLTAVFDSGRTMKIYINGVEKATKDVTVTSTEDSTGNLHIGGFVYFFHGSIDDARIYNRALSATEIQQLYTQGGGKISKTDLITAQLRNGLVGHWTFDGTSVTTTGVIDKSGQNNNGVRVGGTKVATGKIGQAMKFDGADGRIYSSCTGFSNTAISIAFWAKQLAAPSNYSLVVGDQGGLGAVFVFPSDGRFFGQLSLTSAGNVYSGYVAPGTGWNHWVFTWKSGDKLKLYKNGVLASQSGDAYTDTIQNFIGIYIGYYSGVNYFNGYIDDARVYSRALSAAEIQQLYRMGK
ncbi:MAG: LamG domain-containing protein [Patescibacteria group bacterium]